MIDELLIQPTMIIINYWYSSEDIHGGWSRKDAQKDLTQNQKKKNENQLARIKIEDTIFIESTLE